MPLKPSILKGMDSILGSKKVENYVNESEDYMLLEDNSGRVRISNSNSFEYFSPSNFVSGIVAALKGKLDDKGLFLVDDIEFYRGTYSIPKTISNSIVLEKTNHLYRMLNSGNEIFAFISGLNFGTPFDNSGKSALGRNLLLDFFQQRLIMNKNISNLISRIVKVIIVGNSVYCPEDTDLVEKGSFMKQDLNSRIYKTLLQNYDEFDKFLNNLSNFINVDVMPGPDDNSSSYFPDVQINPIMLPESCNNSQLNLVSNPYKFSNKTINGEKVIYLGTSGQNIDNIKKYSKLENTLHIMQKTLEWGHLSPSAPDTLRTYPFIERDPLIFKEIPNVYFVGNQAKFESEVRYYNGVPLRLISIPKFSKSFSIVLLDTLTLEFVEYKLNFMI
jgi:DNA polymerase delta subunit 2